MFRGQIHPLPLDKMATHTICHDFRNVACLMFLIVTWRHNCWFGIATRPPKCNGADKYYCNSFTVDFFTYKSVLRLSTKFKGGFLMVRNLCLARLHLIKCLWRINHASVEFPIVQISRHLKCFRWGKVGIGEAMLHRKKSKSKQFQA